MLVYLEFSCPKQKQRAAKKFVLPTGVSPFVGLVLQDDFDHEFTVTEVLIRISKEPKKSKGIVVLQLSYNSYEGGEEARFEFLKERGWKVFKL